MLLGYPDNHAGDTYRMLNMRTNKPIMSRDIIWLNKEWKQWKIDGSTESTPDEDSDEDELENEPVTGTGTTPQITNQEGTGGK